MKAQAFLLLSLAWCTLGFAREFTDVQGRKLEGELVNVANGQVSIKRAADGKVFTLPMAQFSEEDQKFMGTFTGPKLHYDFDVKVAKTKLGKTKSQQGIVTMESEEWAYKLTLNNRSSGDLGALRIDYWLFRREDDGKNKNAPRVQQAGSTEVAALRRGGAHEFQTKSYILNKEQLRADYYYDNGERNTKRDSAGGLALRVFQGDKEIYSFATNPDLLPMAHGMPAKPVSASDSQ